MAEVLTTNYDYAGENIAPTTPGKAGDDLHALSIVQFDNIISAVQEERAQALSDRRFTFIAGAQWEGGWSQQFQNSIMVEVNKVAQGLEKIETDYRSNRVIVDYRPVNKDASEETAKTLNGMFRADFYWSHGQQATDNAFSEGVAGGIGAWRLAAKYEDEYDADNDRQRICFEMIGDADQSVFWDPNSRLYDKSDAEYCFVLTAMAREAFIEQYGDDKAADWPTGLVKVYYDWYTPKVVVVAEKYYYKDKTGEQIVLKHALTDEKRTEWVADLEPGDLDTLVTEGWRVTKRRRAKRRQVWKLTMSGAEEIAPRQLIPGDCIPVVPFYGKRLFIDNMERSRGHVRLAKDQQRIYNVQISKLTETAAITPIETPIFYPEEVAGLEDKWAEANITRAPYRLRNPMVSNDGTELINTGAPPMLKPPDVPPVLAALIQITQADLAEITTANDGADEAKANISAEAMDIAATRTDAKTFIYQDNMKQSWQRCGEIYQSMAREVYFEEGREVETMDDDGEMETATLYEASTDQNGVFQIRNDLSRGKYKVIADVTEATATKRDKTVKNLVNAATISSATDPELSNAILTTAIMNMDGEGIDDLQAWARRRALASGLVQPTEEEKKQLDEAKASQQPDPQAQLVMAAAEKESALAKKAIADTGKSMADTELSRAKTQQALADANRASADAGHTRIETIHAVARGPEPHPQPPAAPMGATPATSRRVGVFNHLAGLLRGTVNGLSA